LLEQITRDTLQDDNTQQINFEEKLSLMERGLPNCLLRSKNDENQGNPERRRNQGGDK
jgi:hypothetical protein